MNLIKGLISLRKLKHDTFRQVVYEWEDEIIQKFGVKLIVVENKEYLFSDKKTFLEKINSKLENYRLYKKVDFTKDIYIGFATLPEDVLYFQDYNCIPVYLDLWNRDIDFVIRKMKRRTPFVVTSYDMYKKLNVQYGISVEYEPLMIAEKWNKNKISEVSKTIDIIQIGRKNPILHEFAMRYTRENPQYEYIYSDTKGTLGNLKYYSTKKPIDLMLETRESYMKTLSKAKICLVSSPGIDSSKIEAEDIDFPTPRFYESAISCCYLVGRYSDHEEFEIQGINRVCKLVDSYEDFSSYLDVILNNYQIPYSTDYDSFIYKHTVCNWYKSLIAKLEKYT